MEVEEMEEVDEVEEARDVVSVNGVYFIDLHTPQHKNNGGFDTVQ